MYKSLIIICLVALVLMAGCTPLADRGRVAGSGRPASQDFQITGFDSVDIDSGYNVTLARGDGYTVTVTMDDNLLKYASVTLQGTTLRIRAEDQRIAVLSPRIQEASITMPELRRVKLNGASRATLAGFGRVEKFAASTDGASRLSGEVQAADITVSADGASQSNLSGQATTLRLNGNGASRVDLSGLSVQKATVHLDGASNATISASASLDYDLNGISSLSYAGTPTFGLARAQGVSSIRQR